MNTEVPNPFLDDEPAPQRPDATTLVEQARQRIAAKRKAEQERLEEERKARQIEEEKYARARKLYAAHGLSKCKEEQDFINWGLHDRFPLISGNWRAYMRGVPGWAE